MKDDFLEDENFIWVIPEVDKPVKIVRKDRFKIETTDDIMELTLTKKTTIGEVATIMGMSVEEFLEWIGKI